MSRTIAIIVAGGSGTRLQLGFNKAFAEISGRPILAWSVGAFERHPAVTEIIVVAGSQKDESSEQDAARASELSRDEGWKKVRAIVSGGFTRMQSVGEGLRAAAPNDEDLVLIHDAARPFVHADTITAVIHGAAEYGAAVCAVSLKDSVFTAKGGMLGDVLERDSLVSIQTPVAVNYELLRGARGKAEREGYLEAPGIEDSAVVRRAGAPVQVVEGSYENFKVTTREDLVLAEILSREAR